MKKIMLGQLLILTILMSTLAIVGVSQTILPVYAIGTPIPINQMLQNVVEAGGNTAFVILPDYTFVVDSMGHSSASKCEGRQAAAVTDTYAASYLFGTFANDQREILDTNSAYISQAASPNCGNPTGIGSGVPLVVIAGLYVSETTYYYQIESAQSQLYYNGATGCIVRRDTGANVICNPSLSQTQDYFVMESFLDSSSRPVYLLWGWAWRGTFASAEYFADFVLKNPPAYQSAWYVYQWNEGSGTSANSFPDSGDSFTQIAAGPSSATLGVAILNTINRGYGFIDRYWSNMGGAYYATKEHPGVPLAIYNSGSAKYYLAGAQDGEQDHTVIESISATQYRIKFESGTDWDRNDVNFLVTYMAAKADRMKVDIKMEACSPDSGGTITTYFNGASIGSGCWVGTTKSYVSPAQSWGWKSFRYVHRHSNNLIQSLYADGRDITKAKQLQEGLLVNDGFSTDVYDPFFWRAGVGGDDANYGTTPFPDTYTLWDRTWWDWFVYKNGNWETEFPRNIGGTSAAGYPYKSRILGAPALNDWTEYLFPATVLYDAVHAMRDMSKGNWNQAGFDKNHVRSIIDEMGWDGAGTRSCLEAPYGSICYPGYPTYNTAVFLAAATMFYYATGETAYKTKADQAAQWLVNVNVASRYVDSVDFGVMDRPDAYGGFLTGYTSGSTKWKEIASHGFTEAYFWITEQMGWYSKMKAEIGVPVIVSMEPTALAIQALTIYYTYILGGTPPSGPSFKGFHVSSSVAKSVSGYDARAFQGAADLRLYSYSDGANGYAEGKIVAESGLTVAPTTWAIYWNVHGGMAADASHVQRLYTRMRILTSAGAQRWDSGYSQVFSCSSGTCYHREAWTSSFSVSITVNPTDRIEVSFKTVSEGLADMTKSAQFGPYTWPYIGENFGYVHIGYMTASSMYWWGG